MMKKIIALVVVVVGAIALYMFMSKQPPEEVESAAAVGDEIKVGVILAFTGPDTCYGGFC